MKQDQLYFYDYKFECKMRKFSNSMVCEVHSEELKFVEARCPPRSFYIMKREELEEWFCCLSRENRIIGNYCDSSDSYTCARYNCIKSQSHLNGYFVARDWPWQPITWEIHNKFFLQNKPFQFTVHINCAVRCNILLIRKYCFVSCKIIDIRIPKGKKLTKDDNLMLSKMVY